MPEDIVGLFVSACLGALAREVVSLEIHPELAAAARARLDATGLGSNIRIDTASRTAVVQPGLLNSEVKKAAAEYGLWYPPDPGSVEISSIGGNAATNAGGLCCVKYGVTSEYVLGLTVVLADGTAVTLGGPRLKDVAGLSLTKLFVGSEGTLGIITEVTLRLIPAQRPASTLVATFPTLTDATQTVIDITRSMRPSMLEFMDSICINAVEDLTRMGLDRSAAAMLVIQSDEPGSTAAAEIARIDATTGRVRLTGPIASTGVSASMITPAVPMVMNATVVPAIGRGLMNLRRYPIATPYELAATMHASCPHRSPLRSVYCHGAMMMSTPTRPIPTPSF